MNTPIVSIIAVNYYQDEHTAAFLHSVARQPFQNLEVIIVNNGPHNNHQLLREALPEVIILDLAENLGFAGGNNAGMSIARGKYFYLVNNDTILLEDSITPLVNWLETHPQAGAVSPVLCYHAQPDKAQYAGFTHIHPITGRNNTIGKGLPAQQFPGRYATAYAHGAAMMVPRDVVRLVGMMNEEYFLYYEELDWCERMRQKGFQSYVLGTSHILHKVSASTGRLPAMKQYYLLRNRFRWMHRFVSRPFMLLFSAYFLGLVLPIKGLLTRLKGQHQEAAAYTRVWKECLAELRGGQPQPITSAYQQALLSHS